MDQALVEDPEHDIERDQRREDQPGLVVQGGLEGSRRPLEGPVDAGGHSDPVEGILHRGGRIRKGHIRRKVERNGRGRELALVVYAKRRVRRPKSAERRQRHLLSTGGAHINIVERFGTLPEFRRRLHYHPVLIQRVVDRRYLPLPEQVIERGVDHSRRNAQPGGRVTVDDKRRLDALVFLIRIHIDEFGQLAERPPHPRFPGPQLLEIVGLKRELVLRICRPPAHANVLHRHQEQAGAGFADEFATQPAHHLIGRNFPFLERFEGHEHERAVALAPARVRDHGFDRRILTHDGDEVGHLEAHRLERNPLVRLDIAHQPAGVLLREEALGNDRIKVKIEADRRSQQHQHDEPVPQRPPEGDLVGAQHRRKGALARPVQAAVFTVFLRPQQARAHHRCRRQRHHQRNQDRHRQHDGELPEKASDDTAHQQDRNEDRDQRQAHRKDRKADLAGALQRGLHRRHALVDAARNILEHHDCIVDDEPCRDGERHQGQVVEAEPAQMHDAERPDQRHRHGDSWNKRCTPVAQENEHHHDDQRDRDRERPLHIAQAGADGGRAVQRNLQVYRTRDRCLQHGQERSDPVHRRNDICVRLPVQDQQHRWLAVRRSGVAQILHRIGHFGHVRQAHGRAVAVADDQRNVVGGLARLIVRQDLPVVNIVLNCAFGTIRIGGDNRGPHVLQADAVLVKRGRVEFNTHCRQRAAAHGHLPDTFHLRELLREDCGGRVVHLPLSHRFGCHRQDHDRRVGGVDFAVRGVAGQARGQQSARGVDRRLDIVCGAFDVAAQVELQRHPRRAEGAR